MSPPNSAPQPGMRGPYGPPPPGDEPLPPPLPAAHVRPAMPLVARPKQPYAPQHVSGEQHADAVARGVYRGILRAVAFLFIILPAALLAAAAWLAITLYSPLLGLALALLLAAAWMVIKSWRAPTRRS